jgi:hypothetical protein
MTWRSRIARNPQTLRCRRCRRGHQDGERFVGDGYAAVVYVVARFCPLLLSFFVESPS